MGNVYSLTYRKINRLLCDPDVPVSDLAAVVLQDPFLTARLLRSANSRYQSLPAKIESVVGALIVLGFDLVVALVNDQYSQYTATPTFSLKCEFSFDIHKSTL